jgi:hypothetical protein
MYTVFIRDISVFRGYNEVQRENLTLPSNLLTPDFCLEQTIIDPEHSHSLRQDC